ncbi:MAG: baseplate J/gp47 family protein [Calothrix sp. MO_167.B12]|nr:baseplate J/gp47 family protein [Calothrix sp. MO_167.B12]
MTTAQLQGVFVIEPSKDKYSNCTLEATGQKDNAFLVFEGNQAIEHSLYINCPEIFSLPELINFKLIVSGNNISQFSNSQLNWFYWNGDTWEEIATPVFDNNDQFTFSDLPISTALEINGQQAKWLRASLTNITDAAIANNLPLITNIQGEIDINKTGLIPDICLFNNTPLDLTKDFYPFGEQPELNDTFYIALHDNYIKSDVNITINFEVTVQPVVTDNLQIIWEISNGQEWQQIQESNNIQTELNFSNIQTTLNFSNLDTLSPGTVNGETRYWLRARINQGNFGSPSKTRKYAIYNEVAIVDTSPSDQGISIIGNASDFLSVGDIVRMVWIENNTEQREEYTIQTIQDSTFTVSSTLNTNAQIKGTKIFRRDTITETIPPTYEPPLIKSLTLSYNFQLQEKSIYLADNNFEYSEPNGDFQPFTSTLDQQPTLYLGFDKSFDNKTVTLYAQIEPPSPGDFSADIPSETVNPELVWEYSSNHGWEILGVQDETQAFSQSGLIQFIAPVDLSQIKTFNQQLYWLRVRWKEGNFRAQPRLRRILTNTTWAVQAISIHEEILGSSNSEANQVFIANNSPILLGQQLEVQEQQIPVELEADRVKVIQDDVGEIEEIWVVWQEIADFYGSNANDRHYTLDRQSGEISFGDGIAGMIPPRGQNNIRLNFYRTGGGKQGNISSETITQLKTTIPYIDRVINLEPSAGGAQQETLERMKRRVPKQLRHRDRAVTLEDIEDLAYEASTNVARAKLVTPDLLTANFSPLNENLWLDPNNPDISFEDFLHEKNSIPKYSEFKKLVEDINNRAGQVKLIILPYSSKNQPIPSLGLVKQVETYIRSRCEPTLDLIVTPPQWEEVIVNATISPVSLEGADMLLNTIKQRLEAFLHPLTGGKGEGWQFGRYPHKSDFYAIIQSIPGVNYVDFLEISFLKENISSLNADTLIYSGNHTINLK